MRTVYLCANPCIDAELLAQFASQRLFWRLAWLSLSAGELPQQSKGSSAPPLAGEQLSFILNHRRYDS
jgi:hypothetical protein